MRIDLVRARQRLDDPLRQRLDIGGVAGIAYHDGEFVAAQAAAHRILVHQLCETFGDTAQEAVADRVAERVVDRLEPVEIDHHEGAAARPFVRIRHRARQRFVDHQAVGQAGQRVEACHAVDLVGGGALFGDVGADAAETAEGAAFVEPRAGGEFPPAFLAIDEDGQAQVAEAFAALQFVGERAQARGEIAGFPRRPGKHLEEGHAPRS